MKATVVLFFFLGTNSLLFCINPKDSGIYEDAYMMTNAILKGSQVHNFDFPNWYPLTVWQPISHPRAASSVFSTASCPVMFGWLSLKSGISSKCEESTPGTTRGREGPAEIKYNYRKLANIFDVLINFWCLCCWPPCSGGGQGSLAAPLAQAGGAETLRAWPWPPSRSSPPPAASRGAPCPHSGVSIDDIINSILLNKQWMQM